MKTAAGIIFFDDAKGLERCLNSISSYVDLVIAIDGKFREFDADHFISNDDSLEVIKSYDNTRYYAYPNITEIEKRNKYLEIAGNLNVDFLLVIDSDEYAVIDECLFEKNLNLIHKNNQQRDLKTFNKIKPDVFGVKMFERQYEWYGLVRERYNERLLYAPGFMRYSQIHSNLVDINNFTRNFTTAKYTGEINGITLYNDDTLKSIDHINKSLSYQRFLFNNEKEARKRIVGY